MNVFLNTKFVKKVILILVSLILFNFCYPIIIQATEEDVISTTILIGGAINDNDVENGPNQDDYGYEAEYEDPNAASVLGINIPSWDTISFFLANILFKVEGAVYKLINNIFCDNDHKFDYYTRRASNDRVDRVTVKIPLSPESIIKGKFVLFNANIFKNIEGESETATTEEEKEQYYDDGPGKTGIVTGRGSLRESISGWYYALRNFSIVALLSVLVYVGIRMIISTVSQDKAKYKIMFKDWFVALCLVILMHFIMIAILNVSDLIVEAVGTSGSSSISESIFEKMGWISNGDWAYTVTKDGEIHSNVRAIFITTTTAANGQQTEDFEIYTTGDMYAYMLLVAVILVYTIIFAVKYLKRQFTILFLILLGPISCITYPIDKISDGKAQAYNKWFSEFLYQVIIQPFHLLLYVVLVGSAVDLANKNMLYAIICFAVIMPAEKFVKEMFGFKDKLGSPLGAFATGAAASQIFNKLKSSGGSSVSKSGANSKSSTQLPTRVKQTELPGEKSGVSNKKQLPESTNSTDSQVAQRESNSSSAAEQMNNTQEQDKIARRTTDAIGEGQSEQGADTSGSAAGQVDEAQEQDAIDKGQENEEEGQEGSRVSAKDDVGQSQNKPKGDKSSSTTGKTSKKDKKKNKTEKKKKIHGNRRIRDIYNQRLMDKYGVTGKGKIAKKRIGRGVKIAGRVLGKTIKGATTLGATALIGTIGVMTGQGAKGFIAGAAVGSAIGNGVESIGKNAATKIGELHSAYGKNAGRPDFNRNHSLQARNNFVEREGYVPSGKQLQQELDNMYKLSQAGVSNDNLDAAMEQYHANLDSGMTEQDAFGFAAMGAIEAKAYSRKDFKDEKLMGDLHEGLKAKYLKAGYTKQQAEANSRRIIQNAASIKGVNSPAIPAPMSETIDIPLEEKLAIPEKLGVESSKLSGEQQERLHNITVRLHKQGYSESDIQRAAQLSYSDNKEPRELIDEFAITVEYLTSGKTSQNSRALIGSDATKAEVNAENMQRLEVKKLGRPLQEEQITKIREGELASDVLVVDAAREYSRVANASRNSKGNVKLDNSVLTNAEAQLRKQLVQSGRSKDATKSEIKKFKGIVQDTVGPKQPKKTTSQSKDKTDSPKVISEPTTIDTTDKK